MTINKKWKEILLPYQINGEAPTLKYVLSVLYPFNSQYVLIPTKEQKEATEAFIRASDQFKLVKGKKQLWMIGKASEKNIMNMAIQYSLNNSFKKTVIFFQRKNDKIITVFYQLSKEDLNQAKEIIDFLGYIVV